MFATTAHTPSKVTARQQSKPLPGARPPNHGDRPSVFAFASRGGSSPAPRMHDDDGDAKRRICWWGSPPVERCAGELSLTIIRHSPTYNSFNRPPIKHTNSNFLIVNSTFLFSVLSYAWSFSSAATPVRLLHGRVPVTGGVNVRASTLEPRHCF